MRALAEKKGLIAISLLMFLILLGGFVAQYYTYTITQTVKPLTSALTFSLATTSGCTSGSESYTKGAANTPVITIQQDGDIEFLVKDSEVDAIVASGAYWDLTVKVAIYRSDTGALIEEDSFDLIDDGASQITVDTVIADITLDVDVVATYFAKVTFDYWTGDVTADTSVTLKLYVYFVEA